MPCRSRARLLRQMGIAAICPQPGTSRRHRAHPVYPYLLRHRTITQPNDGWAMDITYIPMAHGFVYLAAVMERACRGGCKATPGRSPALPARAALRRALASRCRIEVAR